GAAAMPVRPERLLRHVRRLAGAATSELAADAVLLERFVATRNEPAFTELVRRHGPLVLGVCRRILRDAHHAEDAFQAVWLARPRRAAPTQPPEPRAAWLRGAARRIALRALRAEARRRQREAHGSRLNAAPPADPLDELTARELLRI